MVRQDLLEVLIMVMIKATRMYFHTHGKVAVIISMLLLGDVPLEAEDGYRMPPQTIAALLDAAPTPATSLSPDKSRLLLLSRPAMPSIAEIAQPELRLAGLRINPRTNGPSRRSYFTDLILKSIADGSPTDQEEQSVSGLPKDGRIRNVRWSPDGSQVAFTITRDAGLELWSLEVASAHAVQLTPPIINDTYGAPYQWLPDNRTLITKCVLADRGLPPKAPQVPSGPIVQENLGTKSPAPTFQDLLQNTHDEELFDYYFTSQLAQVTVTGEFTKLGLPAIFKKAKPAPDGQHLLTETLHRPYSYLVRVTRFPVKIQVTDLAGKTQHKIADLPLAENIPISFGSVRTGPREVQWRADQPATLQWTEAQDGGDAGREAEIRDTLFTTAAPFHGQPVTLAKLALRYGGVEWGNDHLALVTEWWWSNRKLRTWIIDPSQPDLAAKLLFDRSFEDRYSDPGNPIMTSTPDGAQVILLTGNGTTAFYAGAGASPQGDRPFLDQMNFTTQQTKRIWQSEAPHFESVVDVIHPSEPTLLTRRESKTEPPNYYLRNLAQDSERALTSYPHPSPQLKNVQKELIRYQRADGVKLTATLYLPPDYKKEDGPLPLLMWAYPQEYKSADAAGQVTDSPYRFVRTHSHSPLLWLLHGYAVLDNPSLPIIGEGGVEPNDTYIRQLVSGAEAAVDEVVRRGVADRERIAIGGHSYGAFMAANLLAHSDLFRAAIARSGAYNRTLTPFSFQAEQRTFWQAPEVYSAMSPFMHADKVNEPILLIHGQADNNSGTFPMQSERYYNALKGLGATAKLVLLPHESHGYRARESVMHMAHEMTNWLDRYVKNAKPRQPSESRQED
jgi:dipeptidyl aminopeptidase/acylaminoacyl peptidase